MGSRWKAIRRWKFLQQEEHVQYPHVSQLFILTSVAKPGIPGAIKNGWVCTADYRMLLGTAVRPVPARMPYISRLCDVGATDVKRWWWWWWWWLLYLIKTSFITTICIIKLMMRIGKKTFYQLLTYLVVYNCCKRNWMLRICFYMMNGWCIW